MKYIRKKKAYNINIRKIYQNMVIIYSDIEKIYTKPVIKRVHLLDKKSNN